MRPGTRVSAATLGSAPPHSGPQHLTRVGRQALGAGARGAVSLDRMEGSHRLQIDYLDARGLPTSSSPEAAAAVLAALGDELSPPEAVLVAWDGSVAGGPAALPAGTTIVDHTGHPLDPTALPLGYHTVLRGDTAVGTVISAPTLAPATSAGRWGVAAPLYALRTDATKGIATYRDLTRLFGWLGGHGGDVVLTLPLLPLYLDEPADWSPYSAVTRRTWSELYVDYDALGAPEPLPVPPLADDGHLDHPALGRYRTARLDAISERLLADPDFVTWRSANALAETYARFRGAQAVFGRQAARWPVSRTEALAAADPVVTRRHLVGAWLADRQLAEVAAAARANGQTLALDVAIGSGDADRKTGAQTKNDIDRDFYAANLTYAHWHGAFQVTGKASWLHGKEDVGDNVFAGTKLPGTGGTTKLNQGKLGAEVGYWIDGFMPYVGVAYARDTSRTKTVEHTENDTWTANISMAF